MKLLVNVNVHQPTNRTHMIEYQMLCCNSGGVQIFSLNLFVYTETTFYCCLSMGQCQNLLNDLSQLAECLVTVHCVTAHL